MKRRQFRLRVTRRHHCVDAVCDAAASSTRTCCLTPSTTLLASWSRRLPPSRVVPAMRCGVCDARLTLTAPPSLHVCRRDNTALSPSSPSFCVSRCDRRFLSAQMQLMRTRRTHGRRRRSKPRFGRTSPRLALSCSKWCVWRCICEGAWATVCARCRDSDVVVRFRWVTSPTRTSRRLRTCSLCASSTRTRQTKIWS